MIKKALIIFLIVFYALPVFAEIVFQDGAESGVISPSWDVVRDYRDHQDDSTITASSNYVKTGSYSFRFYSPVGAKHNQLQLMISPGFNFDYETDYWVAFSIYAQTPGAASWRQVVQWHGDPDTNPCTCDCTAYCYACRNPPWAIFTDGAGFNNIKWWAYGSTNQCNQAGEYTATASYDGISVNSGSWNDIVLHIKFSYSGNAVNQVWVNGVQVSNTTDLNCYYDTDGPYFLIGPYTGTITSAIIWYIDDIKFGINSSYSEMSGGTPTPDTEPPTTDNFQCDSGSCANLSSGTTSTAITWETDEDATCKWDTSDTTYALMSNTATGGGSQSHSDTLSGLSDDSTTYVYVRCQDDEDPPNTASSSDQYAVTVASAGGGSNLLSIDVCTLDVTLPGWSSFSNSFDGETGNNDDDTVASFDDTAAVITCIFPIAYTAPVWRIFGNNNGTLISTTWTVKYKAQSGDSWTTAFTTQGCQGDQWYEQDYSGSISTAIQHLEITVNGDSNGFQYGELVMLADEYESPPPSTALTSDVTGDYSSGADVTGGFTAAGDMEGIE